MLKPNMYNQKYLTALELNSTTKFKDKPEFKNHIRHGLSTREGRQTHVQTTNQHFKSDSLDIPSRFLQPTFLSTRHRFEDGIHLKSNKIK